MRSKIISTEHYPGREIWQLHIEAQNNGSIKERAFELVTSIVVNTIMVRKDVLDSIKGNIDEAKII